jgi:hypothetical protein
VIDLGARPVFDFIPGSPRQVGDVVRVVCTTDDTVSEDWIGAVGRVEYLEYSCGSGQSFPDDPMIGVRFADGLEEFWREELSPAAATDSTGTERTPK